jgi:type 1 glutamine amidotransferase
MTSQAAWLAIVGLAVAFVAAAGGAESGPPRRILIIAGAPDGHPPGTHEYSKSAALLRDHLVALPAVAERIIVETAEIGWPTDAGAIDRADTIALFSSGSDRREQDHPLLEGDHMDQVAKAMARGCGIVTFHYSTFAPERIGPRILEWTGGYFDYETGSEPRKRCSRINTWEARLEPATPEHAICKGVEPVTIKEEFYWNIRFRDGDPRLVPILKTVPPGEKEPQTVAWAVERADGGRGFGFTGGHFFANWQNASFRRLMANAVLWTARADVLP